MGVENLNEVQGSPEQPGQESVEPRHAVREPEQVVDPADEFTPPAETPQPHDDVDVALQDGKETADGPGEEEPGESDFQGYADQSAEKEETS